MRKLLFLAFPALVLLGSCSQGTTGAGGGAGTGDVEIQNLNVTVDAANDQVRLTFVLHNGTTKIIDGCNVGSVSASTGDTVPIDASSFGTSCGGFDPDPETMGEPGFCGSGAWGGLCDYGLQPTETTDVVEISGLFDPATPSPWTQSGTEYTLKLQFIMDDASLVDVTGTATIN